MSHKDTLYIILVANGRVITLVRPKKHSIHPTGWCLDNLYPPAHQLPY